MKSIKTKYSPIAVMVLRLLVGVVFLFSGFSKAIDTWGFVFKIEDYLTVLSLSYPHTLILIGAIAVSSYEFILGLFLLTGCYKRTTPWFLLASMVVMLPLTLWTWIANPVADCGCFGDAIKLSNAATFWKNVVLTIAISYLCAYNRRYDHSLYRPAIQWMVSIAAFFYIISIALYGYNIQPMIDFRPYPAGTNLAALLGSSDLVKENADNIEFIYEKDGQKQSFSIENLPDSTWTFVDRVQVEQSTPNPSAFSIIYSQTGEDVGSEIIASEGDQLIMVIPEAERTDISVSYAANEFDKAIRRTGGSTIGLISAGAEGINRWLDLSMANYPYYTVEDTSLKQLARGSMSVIYLHDGVIQWKRIISAFDFDTVESLRSPDFPGISSLKVDDMHRLKVLTFITVNFLTILALFQEFILRIWRKTKKRL